MGGICPKKAEPADDFDIKKPMLPQTADVTQPQKDDIKTNISEKTIDKPETVIETPKRKPIVQESAVIKKTPKKIGVKDFKIIRILGKGAFGTVCLVKHGSRDDKVYAMKTLSKKQLVERSQVFNTKTEKEILEINKSPFIVKLSYAFQNTQRIYLVMEYAPGGNSIF